MILVPKDTLGVTILRNLPVFGWSEAPHGHAEVAYDNLEGNRFRHATRLVRWRDDRDAASCTFDQLEVPVPLELRQVFGA